MRILLTGVTGQVGAALCAPFEATGSVIAADRDRLDLSRPDLLVDLASNRAHRMPPVGERRAIAGPHDSSNAVAYNP